MQLPKFDLQNFFYCIGHISKQLWQLRNVICSSSDYSVEPFHVITEKVYTGIVDISIRDLKLY